MLVSLKLVAVGEHFAVGDFSYTLTDIRDGLYIATPANAGEQQLQPFSPSTMVEFQCRIANPFPPKGR